MEMKHWLPLAAFAAGLVLFGAGSAAVVRQAEGLHAAAQREVATRAAADAAFRVEQQVSRSMSATYALAAIVRQHGRVDRFDDLAEEMLPLYGGITALQLAPGGVIQAIHPLSGHEPALGHDLLHDPDRRFEATQAIASRRLSVAGPFQLKQGGVGLVGRIAVFRPDPLAPTGESFWGFVAVVVRIEALLSAAQIERLVRDGYAWSLSRELPDRGTEDRFAAAGALAETPVSFQIVLPNGRWTLQVTPDGGWPPMPWRGLAYVLCLAGALGFATVGYLLVRQPMRLRREVAVRVAERDTANAQLRQAQKLEAIGQLAGGIAHDFNNLLAGILGHASVIAEGAPPGSETREAADTIVQAARRGASLTRQLLGFARRGALRTEPTDVHAVAREVLALLERTLDRRIALVDRLGAGRSMVRGDAGQLQQAILNLCVNARDALPDGGTLALESAIVERDADWCALHPGTAPGPHLALSVQDTGPGVPDEIAARIFEPFFTTKEPGRGTGMGLATVYAVARHHQGAILLERGGPGARFTLSLPLSDDTGPAPLTPAPVAAPAPGSGRILVVDDDDGPRAAAAHVLRSLGYAPVTVASGAEALAELARAPDGLRGVLLDLVMPGMDGPATFRALRERAPGLPVLLTSGFARDDRVVQLLATGANGFLEKPFSREDLERALAAALPPAVAPGEAPATRAP